MGGIAQISNGYFRPNRNDTVILSDVGVLSPTLVNELRVHWQKNDRLAEPNSAQGPEISRPSSRIERNAGGVFGQLEKKFQIQDTVTKMSGAHTFKTGVNLQFIYGSEWLFESFFGGAYVFDTDRPFNASDAATYPIRYTSGSGTPDASIDNTVLGLFVEDSWKATRNLTLNLGLRYDRENGDAVSTFKNFPDNDNIAPRLSFAWTPGSGNRTAIRGGFGRFYYRMNGNLGVNMIVQGAPPPDGIGTTVQRVIVNPGYPVPEGPNPRGAGTVGAEPEERRLQRRQRGDAVRGPAQHRRLAPARQGLRDHRGLREHAWQALHARRRPQLPRPGDGTPPAAGLRAVLGVRQHRPHVVRRAAGAAGEAHVAPVPGQPGLHALQDPRRHLAGVHHPGRRSPGLVQPGGGEGALGHLRPQRGRRRAPPPDAERPRPPAIGFDLSGVLQANSRRRFNITTGRDNNGDGVLADRPNLVDGRYVDPGTGPGVQGNLGKNAGIGADYFALDARLVKVFTVKEVSLRLIGEAYNVTNRVNYSGYQGNIQSALFNQPISARRPRTIQVGAQIDF